ncbi:MAG: radical SAM protein [Thermoprotei archaeon]|nr:MAG: radical SAM protein [Thermoprotei archaeon]
MYKYIFGPVNSRRLGRSLGVNNVPYKTCSYSCIYCQLGRTTHFTLKRKCFYNWREIVEEIIKFVEESRGSVDYVTFVPDGEPTLDACIGRIIEGVKRELDVKIAVITNSSLLWLRDVQEDLAPADLVSVKVDAVNEEIWRRINRPHPSLKLDKVLSGILEFSEKYKGVLISETMLVHGVNTSIDSYRGIALFLGKLKLDKTYISIPVRPPAESFVKPPTEKELIEAYEAFSRILSAEKIELLNMPEPPPSKAFGEPITWLLNTVSVHPLKYEYALNALRNLVESPEKLIEELIERELLLRVEYAGSIYIIRNFKQEHVDTPL